MSRAGGSTTSLGRLFQWSNSLTVKKFFLVFVWNFLHSSFCSLPLLLLPLLPATEKSLALAQLHLSQHLLTGEMLQFLIILVALCWTLSIMPMSRSWKTPQVEDAQPFLGNLFQIFIDVKVKKLFLLPMRITLVSVMFFVYLFLLPLHHCEKPASIYSVTRAFTSQSWTVPIHCTST